MKLPQQLCNEAFRFIKLRPNNKIPIEKDWQKSANYKFNDVALSKHNGNLGVVGGYGNIRMIDIDKPALYDAFKLDTFTVKTGSGGYHMYIISDYDTNHVFKGGVGEFRAKNYQCVVPPSVHPNGNTYEVFIDKPILKLKYAEVYDLISKYIRDDSRSGQEFAKVCQLIKQGLTKEQVFDVMNSSEKWIEATPQYRELTYNKALSNLNKIGGELNLELDTLFDTWLSSTGDSKKEVLKQLIRLLAQKDVWTQEEFLNKISKDDKTFSLSQLRKFLSKQRPIKNTKTFDVISKQNIIDARFCEPNLLSLINQEISRKHTGNQHEALALFFCTLTSELENAQHVNVRVTGSSSEGKTNLQKTILGLFPQEQTFVFTRVTQSHIEDEVGEAKRIVLYELNQFRENGANLPIVETFKQLMEDGLKVGKMDMKTQEHIKRDIPPKWACWGTTDIQDDAEQSTRKIDIPLLSTALENKTVIAEILKREESGEVSQDYQCEWVAKSIKALPVKNVLIPYAKELLSLFEDSFVKARIRRDVKKWLSLIKASAFLHQEQRAKVQKDNNTFVVASPIDFFLVSFCCEHFLRDAFEGLDARLKSIIAFLKENQGKYGQYLQDRKLMDYLDNTDWIPRHEIQKHTGDSLNCIKAKLGELKEDGIIETDYQKIVVVRLSGVSNGYQRGVSGYQQIGFDTLLTPYLTCIKKYGVYKEGIEKDARLKINFLKPENLHTFLCHLTGVNLTGVKSPEKCVSFYCPSQREGLATQEQVFENYRKAFPEVPFETFCKAFDREKTRGDIIEFKPNEYARVY